MGTMRDMTWGSRGQFFRELRKEDEMKARDDAYREKKVHGRQEEWEGWVSTPRIRTTADAATQAAPTTAERWCANPPHGAARRRILHLAEKCGDDSRASHSARLETTSSSSETTEHATRALRTLPNSVPTTI
ncbi:hypothetical protein L208DRAFT_1417144 [Tricholoma matsutake]|nr:hypothetical protein L208DRAFT_1417144 [Tricholoma matsutake 945]